MTSLIGIYADHQLNLRLDTTLLHLVALSLSRNINSWRSYIDLSWIIKGEAVEQDETFWGDGIWGESDDESFSEVEVEPDQFDSDFNDTEDEGGNTEDDEKAIKTAGEAEVEYALLQRFVQCSLSIWYFRDNFF